MPLNETKKYFELFQKHLEESLKKKTYTEENVFIEDGKKYLDERKNNNLSEESMAVFLAICRFLQTYPQRKILSEEERVEFALFAERFNKCAGEYFTFKLGQTKGFSYRNNTARKGGSNDVKFMLRLPKDKLSVKAIFDFLDFEKEVAVYKNQKTYETVCYKGSMENILRFMSKEKKIEFCEFLFEDGNFEKYSKYLKNIKYGTYIDETFYLYYSHLGEMDAQDKLKNLRNQIYDNYYEEFGKVISLGDPDFEYAWDNTFTTFVSNVFIRELTDRHELVKFLQEVKEDQDTSKYDNRFGHVSYLIKKCQNIDADHALQEITEVYETTCNDKNMLNDIMEEYSSGYSPC